jgi:hypothetical protein
LIAEQIRLSRRYVKIMPIVVEQPRSGPHQAIPLRIRSLGNAPS